MPVPPNHPKPVLGYVMPPSAAPKPEAERWRMFICLAPIATFTVALLSGGLLDVHSPGSPWIIATAPLALAGLIVAAGELFLPRGLRALGWALLWNVLAAIGLWTGLWISVRFGLLKHM